MKGYVRLVAATEHEAVALIRRPKPSGLKPAAVLSVMVADRAAGVVASAGSGVVLNSISSRFCEEEVEIEESAELLTRNIQISRAFPRFILGFYIDFVDVEIVFTLIGMRIQPPPVWPKPGGLVALVERFDIEPFPDFSAK